MNVGIMKRYVCVLLIVFLLSGGCEAALRRGCQDDEVRKVQIELLRRGYFINDTDKIFGPETEAAVKMFQRHNDLPANGVVDARTYLVLFSRNMKVDSNYDQRAMIIMDAAISMVGVPYVFGGDSRRGIDCSAFVQKAYRAADVDIPRTADLQYESGRKISRNDVQPGDLLFYTTYEPGASHVGIYIGNGQFIQAGSSTGVTISDAFRGYWGKRYYGACRYL